MFSGERFNRTITAEQQNWRGRREGGDEQNSQTVVTRTRPFDSLPSSSDDTGPVRHLGYTLCGLTEDYYRIRVWFPQAVTSKIILNIPYILVR